MAATSSVQWPATPVPEEVKDLINLFFELGDTKDASAGPSMADKVFSHGGEMVRATGTVKGNEQIARSRDKAWDVIAFRKHMIEKVFVGDKDGKDLIVMGTLENYTKENQNSTFQEFAARFMVEGEGATARVKSYQAWLGRILSSIDFYRKPHF
ncbi:hypothetical protein, variant [Exophiala oligosperma]|uniref:SnoaL-like domain-containing protein n=1 Tax=Exophiala oligosperma TaxID=215243 RepID=A0A0D2CBT7_9EURO|nr:uncharacterized protein PV06_00099 [Exophiala oligosperma]XP_016267618.1 hypothetical protein, variant [Exophiala oligosperma]KIW47401.1 hypothetical protein PV06_00099 [Exophiala oligosperma]KIW47402.1 hypothetical protein, variant [Exophiala oligosperma]